MSQVSTSVAVVSVDFAISQSLDIFLGYDVATRKTVVRNLCLFDKLIPYNCLQFALVILVLIKVDDFTLAVNFGS